MTRVPDERWAAVLAEGTKALRAANPDEIAALLNEAAEAYYHSSHTKLTDDQFDAIRAYLHKRAPHHAFFQAIGAPVLHGEKVKLPIFMGSLDKIRDDPKALDRWAAKHPGHVLVSDKLDGNSALIELTHDGMIRLLSRGDGHEGQNIVALLRTGIRDRLPMNAAVTARTLGATSNAPALVRGEVILSKCAWDALAHTGANARNVVAGAMRARVPDAEVAAAVEFVAYELVAPADGTPPSERLARLERAGFRVVHHARLPTAELSMPGLSARLMERRKVSPFDIDGLVVLHDQAHAPPKRKNPTYGFAFKTLLTHTEAEVIIQNVEWNVSKDGYYKPTVHFAPVALNGVTIQRATGFNAGFIEKHRIGMGARVVIIRSGDVIPHIVRVVQSAPRAQMPLAPFEWTETHVDARVPSGAGAGAILHNQSLLEHFVKTLNVMHVGPGVLKKLAAAGFDTLPKFVKLTAAEIAKVDGFQVAGANKVADALHLALKKATPLDWAVATNVFGRGMGHRKLAPLWAAFPSAFLRVGSVPTRTEVEALDGVGETTAKAFLDGVPRYRALMTELGWPAAAAKPASETPAAPAPAPPFPATARLAGMIVVFTGFRNSEWEVAVEALGGRVATTISGKTSLVVAADPDAQSTKMAKARNMGIRILSRDAFSREFGL